jgi:hypothetical protein
MELGAWCDAAVAVDDDQQAGSLQLGCQRSDAGIDAAGAGVSAALLC